MMSLLLDFLQKSQDILHGYIGVTVKNLESLSTSWWNHYLILLEHSQNSMELVSLELKNFCNSLRIAEVWIWKEWNSLLKIFFTACIESIMTIILETFSMAHAWLIPHLMVNSSTFVLVTNKVWWTVLIRGRFAKWMCEIDVAILFLMLASVIMSAELGREELQRTISSSSWVQILFFFHFYQLN